MDTGSMVVSKKKFKRWQYPIIVVRISPKAKFEAFVVFVFTKLKTGTKTC